MLRSALLPDIKSMIRRKFEEHIYSHRYILNLHTVCIHTHTLYMSCSKYNRSGHLLLKAFSPIKVTDLKRHFYPSNLRFIRTFIDLHTNMSHIHGSCNSHCSYNLRRDDHILKRFAKVENTICYRHHRGGNRHFGQCIVA